MFQRFRRLGGPEAEPNLIPVMNLFVAMIPFLLLAVAFFHVGVIPTTLPTHTEDSSDIAPSRNAVTVSIVMNDQGFSLSAMSTALSDEELARLAREIPKREGHYDHDALREALQDIKRRFQESDTIILLPAETVPFEDVVHAMDTARELIVRENGRERRIPLFPVVVLSRTV